MAKQAIDLHKLPSLIAPPSYKISLHTETAVKILILRLFRMMRKKVDPRYLVFWVANGIENVYVQKIDDRIIEGMANVYYVYDNECDGDIDKLQQLIKNPGAVKINMFRNDVYIRRDFNEWDGFQLLSKQPVIDDLIKKNVCIQYGINHHRNYKLNRYGTNELVHTFKEGFNFTIFTLFQYVKDGILICIIFGTNFASNTYILYIQLVN